jgi:hypothetical protein
MNTKELLISKLEKELSYHKFVRISQWWFNHINRLTSDFPFLKIGAKIKTTIDDEVVVCKVKGFIINNSLESSGILVETDLGNVHYYETKKI